MRPVTCPPFKSGIRIEWWARRTAPLPTLLPVTPRRWSADQRVGWAKASDADASGDVPTIQIGHPDRMVGTAHSAFAHPTTDHTAAMVCRPARRVGKGI